MAITTLDVSFLIFVGIGLWFGLSRGILRTAAFVLGLTIGLLAAIKLSPAATQFLENVVGSNSPLLFILGFGLSWAATTLLLRLLARFVEGALESIGIDFINHILGGVFSASIFAVIFSFVVQFADRINLLNDQVKQDSIVYPMLEPIPERAKKLTKILQPTFRDFGDYFVRFLDQMGEWSDNYVESQEQVYDIEEDENDNRRSQ